MIRGFMSGAKRLRRQMMLFGGFLLDACDVVCELEVAVYEYAVVAENRCIGGVCSGDMLG